MSEIPAPPARYHGAAIALHWLVALLLAYQFALGLRLEDKVAPAQMFLNYQQHKSVGIAILVLSLARLALRLTRSRPAEVGPGLEKLAATWAHRAFYAIMILGPLSGWAIVSTAKVKLPTLLFGAIPLPHLPLGIGAHEPAELAHAVLGWVLPALVLLHVAAVFWHLRQRDPVPGRMFPAGLKAGPGIGAGLTSLAIATWLGLAGPIPNLWAQDTVPTATPAAADIVAAVETEAAALAATEAPQAADTALPTEEAALSCDWSVAGGSRLGFTASYAGEPINGSFRDWTAQIKFCEDEPAAGSINASVGLASADTADSSRDENLKGTQFFDIASFPRARFTAKGFKSLGGGRYAADGTLSLRGRNRPVRLTFALKVNGDKATAQGSARINRLAFGVGTDEWAATDQIADAVAINFTIAARRKAP
ncbi:MAG: YceI family protein [Novosphingobium sp.]